ncbi:MAG: DUF362 domain-containing protein [Bacteroidales bacterium]|nr:DUF362 domain-containing protein [Bacteroidales bacterium]
MTKLNRRSFIRSALVTGSGLMIEPLGAWSLPAAADDYLLGVHPFIHDHPDAVFIMRTEVEKKTNAAAIQDAGLRFGRSVFGLTDDPGRGVPLTHRIVLKPNLTCRFRWHEQYTIEGSTGIVTDAHFTEGIIESIRELSIEASQVHNREVNCPDDLEDGGFNAMAQETGIDLQCIETPFNELNPAQITWSDMEEGIFFRRLPHIWPVNAPDTWLLNIAKLKTHSTGLTLCAKNLQGTIVKNYQRHCGYWGEPLNVNSADVQDGAFSIIESNYHRHLSQGIPRWDRPGQSGGLWMETWASRCLDNNAVTKAGLHIVEGIYGRDGDFIDGPNEGLAKDYMCNYILFGLNPFYVDIIGHWIGGHEPGNFGLFHLAREHGRISTFNPANIPIYEWDPASGATLRNLSSFTRYPLKTRYLQKDYGGHSEELWHLVDEHCDYAAFGDPCLNIREKHFGLDACYPNPASHRTFIPFKMYQPGQVLIEILDSHGSLAAVLTNHYLSAGSHLVSWDCQRHPSGIYICRMRTGGQTQQRKIMLIH